MKETVQEIIRRFRLSPLSGEGGMFRRTYCSVDMLPAEVFSDRYAKGGKRPAGSAIQYLITPECYSRLHMLPTDEVYHFYLGDPVRLFLIPPEGDPKTIILGHDVLAGMEVQFVVPAGWWQGSCLATGGEWALLGTTMAPAYADDDYLDADPVLLSARYPAYAEEIRHLTKPAVFPKGKETV